MTRTATALSTVSVLAITSACGGDDTCVVKGDTIVCTDGSRIVVPQTTDDEPDDTPATGTGGGSSEAAAAGLDGSDGQDGVPGADGQDGTPGVDGQDGTPGADGQDGTSCTVVETEAGALITCTDGTQALVANGQDGNPGANGQNGTSCTVEDTVDGARITCTDGSQALIADGQNGDPGADGQDSPSDAVAAKDGTRLQVVTFGGADGSVSPPSVFFDTELGVLCYASRHADGSIRCLPSNQPTALTSYYARAYASKMEHIRSLTEPA